MLTIDPAHVVEVKAAEPPGVARPNHAAADTRPTPEILLRPLRPDDRSEFIELVRSSRAALDCYCPVQRAGEPDDDMFDRQLRMTLESDERGTAFRRVGQLADGRLVGAFNLNTIVRGLEFEADANWWVATAFTGRGLATAGVLALLRHAFADLPDGLGLQRVHAGISADNPASARVAYKAGFRRERGIRSYLDITGQWQVFDAYSAAP